MLGFDWCASSFADSVGENKNSVLQQFVFEDIYFKICMWAHLPKEGMIKDQQRFTLLLAVG